MIDVTIYSKQKLLSNSYRQVLPDKYIYSELWDIYIPSSLYFSVYISPWSVYHTPMYMFLCKCVALYIYLPCIYISFLYLFFCVYVLPVCLLYIYPPCAYFSSICMYLPYVWSSICMSLRIYILLCVYPFIFISLLCVFSLHM